MKRILVLAVVGAAAMSCGGASEEDVSQRASALVEYGNCPPSADWACQYYHPGSVATAYCTFEQCFEMSYGDAIRVVAADELGPFPDTWFVWTEATVTPAGDLPCVATYYQHKVRLQMPDGIVRCRADVYSGEHLYHEHFASNPESGCLGWVECRAF